MNQSTPISDLPGNMNVELAADESSMVDDILQELQMQPDETLLPPPRPSDEVSNSVNYQPIQPVQHTVKAEKPPLEKTYARFVWCMEHVKIPVIVIVLYMLTHNSSIVAQLQTIMPQSILDPFSFGHLITKAIILAIMVEVCRTLLE